MRTDVQDAALGGRIRSGFAWSALSNATMRLASLVTGIVLARLLAPEDFGVFAIALIVQAVLINLAELGLAADLVRHGNIEGRGPTITTIAVSVSSGLTLFAILIAGPFASAMDAPDATPVIQVMALTLVLAGLTVVPYAQLQREFAQGRLFVVEGSSFALGTAITLILCWQGHGPIAIAIGRVAGQVLSTGLQYWLTGQRLRFGWDPEVARSGLRFGLPLAAAGVLSWTLINVDTMVIGAVAGTTLLGYYVLAFNVASWPSSVLGSAIRAVAFPAFVQRAEQLKARAPGGPRDGEPEDHTDLHLATAVVWAAAAPIAMGLILVAGPVIEILYGPRWMPAAAALAGLGAYGAFRVVFEVWVAHLTSRGAGGALIAVQGTWLVALVIAVQVGVAGWGIAGAAWSHSVVAVALMVPVHLGLMMRHGVRPWPLLKAFGPGTAAVIPASAATWLIVGVAPGVWAKLVLGALMMIFVQGTLLWNWAIAVRQQWAAVGSADGGAEPVAQTATPTESEAEAAVAIEAAPKEMPVIDPYADEAEDLSVRVPEPRRTSARRHVPRHRADT